MAIVNVKHKSTSGFDDDALTTTKAGEHILNFGRLTTAGDLANGIFAGADDGAIENFGRIETFGLGAAGIYAIGSNVHIDNFGKVITHGGFFDPDPNVEGDELFSEGILAIGDRFHLANYGSVHVEGFGSSGLAGVGADGVVINYGRVENFDTSIALGAVGDRSQAINFGHVAITATDGIAMEIRGEDAAAVNRGVIEAKGDAVAGVVLIGNGEHLFNSGLIMTDGGAFGLFDATGVAVFGDGALVENTRSGVIKSENVDSP